MPSPLASSSIVGLAALIAGPRSSSVAEVMLKVIRT